VVLGRFSAGGARGSARARLLRHALPNALAPVATVVLLEAALLVPGAVVRRVFASPGGQPLREALGRRDYTAHGAAHGSSVAVILQPAADCCTRGSTPGAA
jgi:ABC-type dipeptide/oligopeptide/nickel transport system permease component